MHLNMIAKAISSQSHAHRALSHHRMENKKLRTKRGRKKRYMRKTRTLNDETFENDEHIVYQIRAYVSLDRDTIYSSGHYVSVKVEYCNRVENEIQPQGFSSFTVLSAQDSENNRCSGMFLSV